jgi:hypothetical protein
MGESTSIVFGRSEIRDAEISLSQIVFASRMTLSAQRFYKPQFIFVCEEFIELAVLQDLDDHSKSVICDEMRKHVVEISPRYYYFVSEGWMVMREKGSVEMERPRDCIDRKQSLVITRFNKDLSEEMVLIPFKINDEKVVYEKEERVSYKNNDGTVYSNAFNFYIEKGAHEEKMKRAMEGKRDG